uniref:Domain of unknown function WSN domain-containing protein n=1 Tax=Caenorhabditis japonica TaxID=281687 RepID=A0A8R1HTY7_CAEJA
MSNLLLLVLLNLMMHSAAQLEEIEGFYTLLHKYGYHEAYKILNLRNFTDPTIREKIAWKGEDYKRILEKFAYEIERIMKCSPETRIFPLDPALVRKAHIPLFASLFQKGKKVGNPEGIQTFLNYCKDTDSRHSELLTEWGITEFLREWPTISEMFFGEENLFDEKSSERIQLERKRYPNKFMFADHIMETMGQSRTKLNEEELLNLLGGWSIKPRDLPGNRVYGQPMDPYDLKQVDWFQSSMNAFYRENAKKSGVNDKEVFELHFFNLQSLSRLMNALVISKEIHQGTISPLNITGQLLKSNFEKDLKTFKKITQNSPSRIYRDILRSKKNNLESGRAGFLNIYRRFILTNDEYKGKRFREKWENCKKYIELFKNLNDRSKSEIVYNKSSPITNLYNALKALNNTKDFIKLNADSGINQTIVDEARNYSHYFFEINKNKDARVLREDFIEDFRYVMNLAEIRASHYRELLVEVPSYIYDMTEISALLPAVIKELDSEFELIKKINETLLNPISNRHPPKNLVPAFPNGIPDIQQVNKDNLSGFMEKIVGRSPAIHLYFLFEAFIKLFPPIFNEIKSTVEQVDEVSRRIKEGFDNYEESYENIKRLHEEVGNSNFSHFSFALKDCSRVPLILKKIEEDIEHFNSRKKDIFIITASIASYLESCDTLEILGEAESIVYLGQKSQNKLLEVQGLNEKSSINIFTLERLKKDLETNKPICSISKHIFDKYWNQLNMSLHSEWLEKIGEKIENIDPTTYRVDCYQDFINALNAFDNFSDKINKISEDVKLMERYVRDLQQDVSTILRKFDQSIFTKALRMNDILRVNLHKELKSYNVSKMLLEMEFTIEDSNALSDGVKCFEYLLKLFELDELIIRRGAEISSRISFDILFHNECRVLSEDLADFVQAKGGELRQLYYDDLLSVQANRIKEISKYKITFQQQLTGCKNLLQPYFPADELVERLVWLDDFIFKENTSETLAMMAQVLHRLHKWIRTDMDLKSTLYDDMNVTDIAFRGCYCGQINLRKDPCFDECKTTKDYYHEVEEPKRWLDDETIDWYLIISIILWMTWFAFIALLVYLWQLYTDHLSKPTFNDEIKEEAKKKD